MILDRIPPHIRLVALRFLEIFSRGVFILIGTYSLPVVEAGQFGLLNTLVVIFMFIAGFERQLDFQRMNAGKAHAQIQRHANETLRFYFRNYCLVIPAYIATLFFLLKISPALLVCTAIIVIAEHLLAQAYVVILMEGRYQPLLFIALFKNIGLILSVTSQMLPGHHLSLEFTVWAWVFFSCASLVLLAVVWKKLATDDVTPTDSNQEAAIGFWRHYHRSYIHFIIGIIAQLSLQADRLIVGGILQPVDVGIYFRNITLVSLAYQVFYVASFNRISPRIYAHARTKAMPLLRLEVQREHRRIAALCIAAFCVLFALDRLEYLTVLRKFHIDIELQAILLCAFLMRTSGDFYALLLNARHMEKFLLRHQTISVVLGMALSICLTWKFGLTGTIFSSLLAPLVYWAANRRTLTKIED